MEEAVAYQQGGVQSLSGTVEHPYEQINMSVQPTGRRQIQSPSTTTTTVKVILGLLGVLVLVALVVAVVALFLIFLTTVKVEQNQPTTTTTTTSRSDTNQTSCYAIHSSQPEALSGVYTIYIGGHMPGRKVYCDMETGGGGWTMFQRRQDGSVSFIRTWHEYRRGFGSAEAELWLGNSLDSSNSSPFSTKDRDNIGNGCMSDNGGWWCQRNYHSNLNGRYHQGGVSDVFQGVYWYYWRGHYSYKATSMMTRPQ